MYKARQKKTEEEVAFKIDTNLKTHLKELEFMRLKKNPELKCPHMIDFETKGEGQNNVIVMNLLGKNLEEVLST